MKIQSHSLFVTPKSVQEIFEWIERHPQEMKVSLYTAAMMTWNYLAAQTEKEEEIKPPTIE